MRSFTEYTDAEIEAAFDKVKNPNDWKDAIDVTLATEDEDEIALISYAITYYTATEAYAETVNGKTRFRSIGYRMGPAGDY